MLDFAKLQLLCEPFGLPVDRANFIARSQNDVYAFGDSILRISHGRRQTRAMIENELGWIDDLSARGLPVCRARRSGPGRRCERVVIDDVEYLVVHFDKAPGRKITVPDVTDDLYASLGKLTARMHAASFDVDPPAKARFSRPKWFESRLVTTDIDLYTPPGDERFRFAVRQLVKEIKSDNPDLPGLVHGDISFSNVFLNGPTLTVFDFDNCEIGTVVQDLATVFYDAIYCHLLNRVPPAEVVPTYRRRCRVFLDAYRSVRSLPPLPTLRFQKFLILREGIIYAHYCRIFADKEIRPAFRQGMDQMRANVERSFTEAEFEDC